VVSATTSPETVAEPETETDPEIGWVAGKLLTLTDPDTGWVAGKLLMDTEPETNCDAGKLLTSVVVGKLETSVVIGKLLTSTVVGKFVTSKEVGKLLTSKPGGKLLTSKPMLDIVTSLVTETSPEIAWVSGKLETSTTEPGNVVTSMSDAENVAVTGTGWVESFTITTDMVAMDQAQKLTTQVSLRCHP